MQLRSMPVFALALGSMFVASCSKQAEAPPPPAPGAAAPAAQPAAQTGGQTTNFENQTQAQALAAAPPASN